MDSIVQRDSCFSSHLNTEHKIIRLKYRTNIRLYVSAQLLTLHLLRIVVFYDRTTATKCKLYTDCYCTCRAPVCCFF